MKRSKHIVSTEWLHNQLYDPNLIILEVCQAKNFAGLSDTILGSISGSISVDLKKDFSDPNGSFSNTFPRVDQFESACNRLGIDNNNSIIIVDRLGIYTSPRLCYLFRAMGHDDVAILDGGLPAWIEDGYEVVNELKSPTTKDNYSAELNSQLIKSIDEVSENIQSQESILIDARSADRFHSRVPEPRSEIRSGNIPKSINIPYKSLLDQNRFKSEDEIGVIFANIDIGNKPLIISCGSGVTACVVMLAAELIVDNPKSIYDGSWTEWASIKE